MLYYALVFLVVALIAGFLGFGGVAHVRAGRSFSFEVDAADEGTARTTATELADRLLAPAG